MWLLQWLKASNYNPKLLVLHFSISFYGTLQEKWNTFFFFFLPYNVCFNQERQVTKVREMFITADDVIIESHHKVFSNETLEGDFVKEGFLP